MIQPETFAEAMQRIKRGAAKQPEADRLGYIKGAIDSLTSLPEPDRDALFDLLMEIPSQHPAGPFTLNQNIQHTANPTISQVASPTQNANPHIEVAAPAPSPEGGGWLKHVVTIVGAVIGLIGVLGAAWIAAHAPKKDDAATAARPVAKDTSRGTAPSVATPKAATQAGVPKKP
jgi:hypothetical protein